MKPRVASVSRVASLAALVAALGAGCTVTAPVPAALEAGENCAGCRMAVSDARLAGQIVAPGELPLFFDDLGCLGGYLSSGRAAKGAVVFVADHRTKAWVPAAAAVFTRVSALATPMGSHLVAHASPASRDADLVARDGVPVAAEEIFGVAGPAAGGRQ